MAPLQAFSATAVQDWDLRHTPIHATVSTHLPISVEAVEGASAVDL